MQCSKFIAALQLRFKQLGDNLHRKILPQLHQIEDLDLSSLVIAVFRLSDHLCAALQTYLDYGLDDRTCANLMLCTN